MIIHLLRHELLRHRLLYPLAALLIFCARFLHSLKPGLGDEVTSTGFYLLLFGTAAVSIHLLLRCHPWHDDRAFWRTRPVSARQLLVSQSLAIALVVLLPFGAALLLSILPLNLGGLTTSFAIILPVGVALAAATSLAACASLSPGRGRPDITPYLAVFVAPLLSSAVYGLFHLLSDGSSLGPSPGGETLSSFVCVLSIVVVAATAAWLLSTLQRNRRAAIATLLLTGIALPWVAGLISFNFFQNDGPPTRNLGIHFDFSEKEYVSRPRWTGLGEDEFFAPRIVHASWAEGGKHIAWMWPRNHHRSHPGFLADLLQPPHQGPLEDQHRQFVAATDIPGLWDGIRARLPKHSTWRTSEPLPRVHEALELGVGLRQSNLFCSADGDVFRLIAMDPISSITTGSLPSLPVGRLDILRVASDDSQIAILLSHITPNSSLGSGFSAPSRQFSTTPPVFWAVLFHPPSSTAYACHGLRVRVRHNGNGGMIINREHQILTFRLPRLETSLLGLDSQQVLAESTLHLFLATPVAEATARINEPGS